MTLFFSAPQTRAGILTELHNTGQQPIPALVTEITTADIPGLGAAIDAAIAVALPPAFASAFPPAFDAAFPPALEDAFPIIATALAGTGLHVQTSGALLTTRIRPRLVQVSDYFLGGTVSSGQIGQIGWSLVGLGTPAATRANGGFSINVNTRLNVATSNVSGDRTSLVLGETESRQVMRPTDLDIMQCCWGFSLSNKRVFFGLSENFALAPAAMNNAIGIFYDSAVSPNYQIISRAASAGAPVVTSSAVPASTAELITIRRIADDNYEFYVGNTLIGTILAGVADTTSMNVGFRVETLAASAASLSVGYFGLQANGASALDDDNFLQG